MYSDYELRQMPLSLKPVRLRVERFLDRNGLRLDAEVDYYVAIFHCATDTMVAGGGLHGNIIKCVAVDESVREEGLTNRLVSHLVSTATAAGHTSVRVFTKPRNTAIFVSLGFKLIAPTEKAALLENGNGLEDYRKRLIAMRQGHEGTAGIIVMNANPFTRGHRYLIERAAQHVDWLYVIAVSEDCSVFSYGERLAMMRAGTGDIGNVTVCEGSDYAVSATTFPTYFLKELTDVADVQMRLDLEIFARHIAPALSAAVRFVGSEPADRLTRRYNELMKEVLPAAAIRVMEIPRLCVDDVSVGNTSFNVPISASWVRQMLDQGSLSAAAACVYPTTIPYLIAHLATRALLSELDTTPKPGLVDRHDSGAHTDMDHKLMSGSIRVLHPFFVRLALLGYRNTLTSLAEIRQVGIEGEEAMMRFTQGVNTHRGALFSMGLAVVAASHLYFVSGKTDAASLKATIARLAALFTRPQGTHGSAVEAAYKVGGALANACAGYPDLFNRWLPFYNGLDGDEYALHKTLLLIMSDLDDTNIYYRRGKDVAESVRRRSEQALRVFSTDTLEAMNRDFIRDNISPGGSADMLALTVFAKSILT